MKHIFENIDRERLTEEDKVYPEGPESIIEAANVEELDKDKEIDLANEIFEASHPEIRSLPISHYLLLWGEFSLGWCACRRAGAALKKEIEEKNVMLRNAKGGNA